MVKSIWTQGEMIVRLRGNSLYSQTPKRGSLHAVQGHQGSVRFWLGGRRQEQGAKSRLEPLLGISQERQGKVRDIFWDWLV